MRRRLLAGLLLILPIAMLSTGEHYAADETSLSSRTFTARYRGVDEIVALIQPAVSERGSYSVQPRIKTVTVTDTEENLKKMADLIASFDLPPRVIKLVIQLMRAEEGTPQEKPQRRLGLPPSVIQDVTKWGLI